MFKDIKKLKQDIIFEETLRGSNLRFFTTWGLFSPEHIDEGTRMLVEEVDIMSAEKVLDLGCGYGPIGLAIAKEYPQSSVHMIDKDFVAVEYAKKNADANNINNCQIYLSNAFDQVPVGLKFDIIVSNLPAKINKEFFWIMINDSKEHLKRGGKLYVVTISGLKEFIKRNFNEFFGNYKKIRQGKTYSIYMAQKVD